MMSRRPFTRFHGTDGYVGRSSPLVTLSRFFRLSPMAMSSIQVASRRIIPSDDPKKSSTERIDFVRSCNFSMADKMSVRMSRASDWFSIDNDGISFNSSSQTGIEILMITDNVDRTSCFLFEEILCIHEQEWVGS